MRTLSVVGVALGALVLVGCGSTQATTEFSQAKASIRAAEEVGAEQHPEAAFFLEKAREKYQLGEQLIEDGDEEKAAWVLEKAQADADLAVALSKEGRMREAAQQTSRRIQQLTEAQRRL